MPTVVASTLGVPMPVDLRMIVRFALDKSLHFTPGTGQSYSNLGYSILGLVIGKVSGMSYEEYCVRQVLEPLGIYDMALGRNFPEEALPFEVSYYEVENAPLKPSVDGSGEMLPASRGGNDIEALGAAGGVGGHRLPTLCGCCLRSTGLTIRRTFFRRRALIL